MSGNTVGESVRLLEAWVYRQAFRQKYLGGDNALLVRLGHHVFVDPKWPRHRGHTHTTVTTSYITEIGSPDWVHEAFDVARRTY